MTIPDLSFLQTDAVISAAIGAVLGAGLTHLSNELFSNRRELRVTRRQVLGDVLSFACEYRASLCELESTFLSRTLSQAEGIEAAALLARLEGKMLELELRVWNAFPQRLVRAGFTKLCSRLERTARLLMEAKGVPLENFSNALVWIEDQQATAALHLSNATGLNLRDPSRITFVGFRRVTQADKDALSFEDGPPPWERHHAQQGTPADRPAAASQRQTGG